MIVADAKYTNPRDEVRTMYFRPLTQEMTGLTEANAMQAEGRSLYINSVTLHFQRPPQNLDAMVRRTLANINPNLTVAGSSVRWTTRWAGNFTQERLVARLTTLFGAAGAGAGIGGTVWDYVVPGGAEDERDRAAHGSGSGPQECGADGDAWRVLSGGIGVWRLEFQLRFWERGPYGGPTLWSEIV